MSTRSGIRAEEVPLRVLPSTFLQANARPKDKLPDLEHLIVNVCRATLPRASLKPMTLSRYSASRTTEIISGHDSLRIPYFELSLQLIHTNRAEIVATTLGVRSIGSPRSRIAATMQAISNAPFSRCWSIMNNIGDEKAKVSTVDVPRVVEHGHTPGQPCEVPVTD